MNNETQIRYSDFVRTFSVVSVKKDNTVAKSRLRFNPFLVSSYYESFYQNEGVEIPITIAIVGGASYMVDMTIEEFDDMMSKVDRGMKIE